MLSIKEIFIRNKTRFIIALSVILILTAVIELYSILFVNVTSNDECLWVPKNVGKSTAYIVFDKVKVGGVTWNAGIRDGDELLEINHQKLSDEIFAQTVLDSVKAGSYADYTIKKAGKIINTKVFVKKLIQIGNLAGVMFALFQMLIGFIVLMAKPDGKVQKIFYAIGVAYVLGTTLAFFSIKTTPAVVQSNPIPYLLVGIVGIAGICSESFLFLTFFWTFPKPFKILENKWVKRLLIILPSICFVILFSTSVRYFGYNEGKFDAVISRLTICGYLFSALQITALISLIINYRKLKTKEEKKPVFIILVALIIAMTAALYTARIAPAISDTIFNSPQYYTPIILIILMPIAFAYSIFKYQLMDVSVVVKNTVLYGTATISLAALYFLVIYVLGQSISNAIGTDFQGVIAGGIFIIFALVFQSTKDRFQDFLTEKFYPEQFAYQKVLVKFSGDVTTIVGYDNILDSLKTTFVEMLKLNCFGILIKDKKNDEFYLTGSVGFSNEILIADGIKIQKAYERKLAVSSRVIFEQNDVPDLFHELSARLIEEGIYTVVPMVIKSKVIGLLLFGLKRSGSQFAGKDLDLLTAAANQAAISIENARLYETEAEKIKMEQDLSLARKIQQGLLPKCMPNLNGLDICGEMIPAMQVGGDYYDLIQVTDTKLFVVVGDVSGKGLAASLYMTKLQTMIQLACAPNKSPKEIMVELNRRYYDAIERNSFVTMTLALFDTENKTVTFCRAGHMPVLTATNGNVIHSYRTQGIGVGLEKGIIFERTLIEEVVKLKPGQIYAFFSDGITEAMNEYYDLFGEDKLSEILKGKGNKTSTQIMNDIWVSLNTFRGSAEQNDDMTMVIVKVG